MQVEAQISPQRALNFGLALMAARIILDPGVATGCYYGAGAFLPS